VLAYCNTPASPASELMTSARLGVGVRRHEQGLNAGSLWQCNHATSGRTHVIPSSNKSEVSLVLVAISAYYGFGNRSMGDNMLATFDYPYLFANEASEMDFLRVMPAAYRILVPLFNCKDTDTLENLVFTYREFANICTLTIGKAMSEISFIDMREDGMLVLKHGEQKGQPFCTIRRHAADPGRVRTSGGDGSEFADSLRTQQLVQLHGGHVPLQALVVHGGMADEHALGADDGVLACQYRFKWPQTRSS
ncbi:hypothetical protein K466DRAFT_570326, partial [Polyporus arcularius HHB13444]